MVLLAHVKSCVATQGQATKKALPGPGPWLSAVSSQKGPTKRRRADAAKAGRLSDGAFHAAGEEEGEIRNERAQHS